MSCLRQTIFLIVTLLLLSGCAAVINESSPELLTGTAQNPVEIRGALQQDLRLAGVIRLTGDLFIPGGRSLFVEPGSQILVVGNDSTKIDPEYLDKGTEILVKGRLTLAGQQDARITLSLDDSTPAGENWTGIELVAAESAILNYVDILGAEIGILSLDSSLQLGQVNILGSRYGLLLQGGGALAYHGGRISGGDAGLLCFDRTALDLGQLKILDNQEEGLYLANKCTLKHHAVTIERNDLGVVASEGYRESLHLSLRDNRINFKPLADEILQ